MLERWSKEKRLKFDEVQQRWMWDAEVIAQRNDSEDSRRLNEAALAKLREETKVVLGIAAAIGSRFSLSLLAEASDNSLDVTLGLLEAAVNEGIVCPEDENLPGNIGEDVYLFIDDQVQRMVYTHYQDNSAEWHLKIGRLLQRRCSDEDLKAKSNIIDHLNMGMERMSEREKGELAAHNLEAGLQAQDAAQFSRARHYFDIGLQLIPHTSTDYRLDSLASRLKVALARCEYMCGHTEVAKHQLQELLKYQVTSSSRTERSKIFINLIQMHTFEDNERAVHFGREALSEFGWLLRTNVSKATLMKEVIHTSMFLYRMKEQRYHASPNDEPDYRALSELMEAVFFPLLIQNAESLIALYARFIRYGLQKGINKYLVRIIGIYELILQRGLPSVFHVRPATQLERMQSVLRTESNLQYQLSLISGISKQLENPAEAMVHLDKALHWSVEHSDALYANLAVVTSLINHLGDIHELSERLAYFEHKSKTFADHSTLEVVSTAHAYQAALQDETLHERFVAIPISHGTEHEPEDEDNYSCGCRLEVAYLAGKYREALYWAKRGRANELDQDWVRIRKHRLLEMLALAAIYPEASSKERICIQKTLQKQLRLMKKRKGYLGSASSAYLLLQAEYNGIVLADHDATRGYSSAIRAARAEKNGLMEGIACERLAVYYQNELGSQAGTMIAMMDACTAYSVWGISSKVTQIRSQYADLLNHAVNTYAGPVFEMDMNSQAAGMPLHAGSGARSYPIQAEAEPRRQTADWTTPPSQGQVMERLLTAALHQVGADRGLVLNYRDEIFRVEAKSESSSYGGDRDLTYAESILRHTVMTDKPIVLQDALESHYIKDPYIQDRCPRSILCMRIMIPGERAVMLLYLENGHVPKVFTDQDVNVLELMIIQMFYHKMLAEDTASTAERVEAGINNKTGPGRLVESLTNREMEILKAISEGLSNKGIAERFGITEPTVKSHISNIFGKLDVKRRGQAVARARDLQLIP
ncbi:LuxR C-terminal-related transcriptional regulator [Paenibacillus sp. JCM 10914]|uniref:LuxR C-terminal-related transcriptional regulator n=1 Tax=Paenibacillus sp. JCM 10914 TaxID=1236974 RepID=UPI0022B1F5E9|nr:LuxR C-terminal-related transcriptional regulator [Paenibacillus sp. JCM 10914]